MSAFSLARIPTGLIHAGIVPRTILNSMILIIDNYDSFTYNLVQRFGEIDSKLDLHVVRNNKVTLEEIRRWDPERIVISPGPCTPSEAGVSRDVIREFGPSRPTLGVCLGHQCMGDVFGWKVERASRLMHGKVSPVYHDGTGVFAGMPNPFSATRYHSLLVNALAGHDELVVTAWTQDPGQPREIMGMRHRQHPIHGVQFHPESFLTEQGTHLLANFLALPAVALPAGVIAAG